MGSKPKNWEGRKAHRLTAISRRVDENGVAQLLVRCDCGNIKEIPRTRWNWTRSCGCLQIEAARRSGHANMTHGHASTRTREFRSWEAAKRRCFNVNDHQYDRYGGRGITMCDRWANSFSAFLEDMGLCPPGLTIDRENNDGNYEPGNCRWATKSEQAANRRSSIFIEHDGKRMTVTGWARFVGINDGTLRLRLKRMSFVDAISAPVGSLHGRQ